MNYNKINKNAVKSWFIGRMIFLSMFSVIYFIGMYKFLVPKYGDISVIKYGIDILSIVLIGYLAIYTFVFPIVEYKEWRYKICKDKIELINGVIIRQKTIIPISRIQHLDIQQGPIYRKFGMSSIEINTAGASHTLPALTNKEAEEISEKLKDMIEMSDKIE
ncbi:PH domain-containing protein [Clostridium aestuarii]|uniref:PH domain-containing protein n=1 Tax=Clostridium aestuarii TaxID=338193 RepID=A0ABT4CVX9_9CLOT|nr:PH domain-containing protein [Clostridium aestuarii]MCY6483138.1 PH domain-containing protein [Clostridium aestuarii]